MSPAAHARLRLTAIFTILAVCGLLAMSRFGPLQAPSVLVYSSLAAALCGLLSAGVPPGWLGFRRRVSGPLTGLAMALLLFTAGWWWPISTIHTASPATLLDRFLPEYEIHERHEILVHAPPARVRAALDQVTFQEIPAVETLGRIRAAVLRAPIERHAPAIAPIVEMIQRPQGGFFLLADSPREFVFGLAGQPWNNRAIRLTPQQFPVWAATGHVKIAANFLIEDAGPGRSRLITETRIAAFGPEASRAMARYWALVYPGSGLIRVGLLQAIRRRAERP